MKKKTKSTQKDKVQNFCFLTIKKKGSIKTWDLEAHAKEMGMMANSATRRARTLCADGVLKHSLLKNKQPDKHSYVMA